jgi:hypothetical protein
MPARRRSTPPHLLLTPQQLAAIRRAERHPHTRQFRGLVASLEHAVRLAGELAGRHDVRCPCPVCSSPRPEVASAAVSAAGELCGELLDTLNDQTGGTVRRRRAA